MMNWPAPCGRCMTNFTTKGFCDPCEAKRVIEAEENLKALAALIRAAQIEAQMVLICGAMGWTFSDEVYIKMARYLRSKGVVLQKKYVFNLVNEAPKI